MEYHQYDRSSNTDHEAVGVRYVFGTIRIQQRFTPEAVQKAGISWIARILPETLFRGMADDEMGDALQKLADDFEKRISDSNDIRHEK